MGKVNEVEPVRSFWIAACSGLWSSLLQVILGVELPLILQQLTGTIPSDSDVVSSQKEVAPSFHSGCGETRSKDGWNRRGNRISVSGLEGIRCFNTPTEQCLNISFAIQATIALPQRQVHCNSDCRYHLLL